MTFLTNSNGTVKKVMKRRQKGAKRTKSDETEQKVAKQTSLYGNKNKK